EPARALRPHPRRLVGQPGGALGGVRGRGRAGPGPHLAAVPGRVPDRVRTQPDPVAPGPLRQTGRGRAQPRPATPGVGATRHQCVTRSTPAGPCVPVSAVRRPTGQAWTATGSPVARAAARPAAKRVAGPAAV